MTAPTNANAPQKPPRQPERPWFSSGPTSKRPGWSVKALESAPVGRSNRSKVTVGRIQQALDLSRSILEIPADYKVFLMPGSDTGAFEAAMWNLLGPRKVQLMAFENFGDLWADDAVKHLKLDAEVLKAPYGRLPDLGKIDPEADLVFPWNGTTSGGRIPNGDWIKADRQGLTICDATSGVFAMDLPWDKLDVVTWSWQKVLGGEAAHGMLALSPRAVERLNTYTPPWPMPKIFRLTNKGKFSEGIFAEETINTPSMLAVEDAIDSLKWAESIGGLPKLKARCESNLAAIASWVGSNGSWKPRGIASVQLKL